MSLHECGYKLNHQIRTVKTREGEEKEKNKKNEVDTLQGNTGNFTKRGNGNSWEMGWMSMDASRFAEMYYRWCQMNAPGRFCSFSLPAVPFNHLQ